MRTIALAAALLPLAGCGSQEASRTIDLWHQMRPEDRAVLDARILAFEAQHPGVDVRALYKETEELRSGLVSAVLAGSGPEIIYGPSDTLGLFQAMGALQDMSPWMSDNELGALDPRAVIRMPSARAPRREELIFLGDRFGNHLGLVYNRRFIKEPPSTTDQLIELAKANTVDDDGDGAVDRYGIVWNYTEPFFFVPFLTGFGGWVFDESDGTTPESTPSLDTPEMAAALGFVAALANEHRVLPRSADYETARALFVAGKAAMIIDGDWSWQGYLSDPALDAAVAVLPTVPATGRPMAPMVAPKGYSLTAFAEDDSADPAMELIEFLLDADTQRSFLADQRILPSRVALRSDPLVTDDPVMATSVEQAERGRAMPTSVAMRSVWDAMRPPYQLLMSGQLGAEEAARRMQRDALTKIETMTTLDSPDRSVAAVYGLAVAGLAALASGSAGRSPPSGANCGRTASPTRWCCRRSR